MHNLPQVQLIRQDGYALLEPAGVAPVGHEPVLVDCVDRRRVADGGPLEGALQAGMVRANPGAERDRIQSAQTADQSSPWRRGVGRHRRRSLVQRPNCNPRPNSVSSTSPTRTTVRVFLRSRSSHQQHAADFRLKPPRQLRAPARCWLTTSLLGPLALRPDPVSHYVAEEPGNVEKHE